MLTELVFLVLCVLHTHAYWRPNRHMAWNYVIGEHNIDTRIHGDMFVVDLFETDQNIIDNLHSKGKHVVCYFSAGTREAWRPDANTFPTSAGKPDAVWDHETYIDIRDATVKEIMRNRIALAVRKHCDCINPANVDAWTSLTGLSFTRNDQLKYNKFLASEAHSHNLCIGLENDGLQIKDLVSDFDFAINEQCIAHNHCYLYQPFIDAGKAVFNVEYVKTSTEGHNRESSICAGKLTDFNTLIKIKDLDHGCHCALTNWKIGC